RRHKSASVNPALDLRTFFVVIPGNDLQSLELVAGRKKLAGLVEGRKPSLPALVVNLAVAAELGEGIVKSLVGCARSGPAGSLRRCVKPVERREFLVKSIGGVDVHPLKCAAGKAPLQTFRAAEQQQLAGGQ